MEPGKLIYQHRLSGLLFTVSDPKETVAEINKYIDEFGGDDFITEEHFTYFPCLLGEHAWDIKSRGVTIKHALRILTSMPHIYEFYQYIDNISTFLAHSDEKIEFDDYDMYFKIYHVKYALEIEFNEKYDDASRRIVAKVIWYFLNEHDEIKSLLSYYMESHKPNTLVTYL